MPLNREPNLDSDSASEEERAPVRPLSEKEKACVTEEFKDWVSDNRKVLLKDVREQLRFSSKTLRRLLKVPGMDIKIANRVRHLQSVMPASLPLEETPKNEIVHDWQEAAESVTSYETASSSRREWSEEDAAVLRTLFAGRQKCPTRQEVNETQETSDQLKELIERNNLERTYTKVKNMLYKAQKR